MPEPVWLITGCSTGFGRHLADAVIKRGWNAVVTARNPAQISDIVEGHENNALAIKLDVTDPSDIATVVEAAKSRFGRIDVLVNNAGYGYIAAVEEGEDKDIRAMFETNFFGLAALTRAVLPGMREQGSGGIINISSVGGLVGNPGSGYYAATKFAVEGMSEALSKEVASLGIKVMVVEPGPFRTDWAGRSLQHPGRTIEAYAETVGKRRDSLAELSGNQVGDPVRGAEAMIEAISSDKPPLHLVLGKPGLELVRTKLKALHEDLDGWEKVTLSADYPEAAE